MEFARGLPGGADRAGPRHDRRRPWPGQQPARPTRRGRSRSHARTVREPIAAEASLATRCWRRCAPMLPSRRPRALLELLAALRVPSRPVGPRDGAVRARPDRENEGDTTRCATHSTSRWRRSARSATAGAWRRAGRARGPADPRGRPGRGRARAGAGAVADGRMGARNDNVMIELRLADLHTRRGDNEGARAGWPPRSTRGSATPRRTPCCGSRLAELTFCAGDAARARELADRGDCARARRGGGTVPRGARPRAMVLDARWACSSSSRASRRAAERCCRVLRRGPGHAGHADHGDRRRGHRRPGPTSQGCRRGSRVLGRPATPARRRGSTAPRVAPATRSVARRAGRRGLQPRRYGRRPRAGSRRRTAAASIRSASPDHGVSTRRRYAAQRQRDEHHQQPAHPAEGPEQRCRPARRASARAPPPPGG